MSAKVRMFAAFDRIDRRVVDLDKRTGGGPKEDGTDLPNELRKLAQAVRTGQVSTFAVATLLLDLADCADRLVASGTGASADEQAGALTHDLPTPEEVAEGTRDWCTDDPPEPDPNAEACNATVLVVDPHPHSCSQSCQQLDHHGYRVLAASSGHEALQLCREQGEIDLLVIDLDLEDIAVSSLIDEARALIPSVGIVYVSGRCRTEPRVQTALEKHNGALVEKPVDHELLNRILHSMLPRQLA